MAKTTKDQPFHIVFKEAYKDTPLHHEHTKLGKTYYTKRSTWYVFDKGDSANIADFEHWLQEENLEYEKHEEDRAKEYFKNLYYTDPYYWYEIAEHQNETGEFLAQHFIQNTEHVIQYNKYDIQPKKIYFRIIEEYVLQEYTAYCTDYEHFDSTTFTDTRDNKTVTCLPQYDKLPKRYFTPHEFTERHARSTRKTTLKEMAKLYNSGEDINDDNPILVEEFKPYLYYHN